MMKIHRIWLLAIAASLCCQIGVFGAEDEDDAVHMFKEYLHIDSLLTHQHQAERQAPAHVIDDIRKQRDQIAQELLRNQDEAGPALAKEYEKSRGAGMRGELMNFAMQTGIARPDFLDFAREVIRTTDLDAPRDPMLTIALEYLGEQGEQEDLDLMTRLDGHVNQTYAQIRDRFAARLKERLSKGMAAEPKNSDSLEQQAGSREVNGVETLVESEGKKSSRPPVWGLLIIVVAVVGIFVLLIRALLRRRAS